jgi:hypothetical protein
MPVQILGPFRQEYRLTALGTVVLQSASNRLFSRARRSELHDAFSAMLLPLARMHGTAMTAVMKQQS